MRDNPTSRDRAGADRTAGRRPLAYARGSSEAPRVALCPAYILSGGKSSRFGSDKALAALDGRPMIVRLADQLSRLCVSVVVVADRPDKYAHFGLTTIADDQPGCGPLGGLATALRHCDTEWLLACAADMAWMDDAAVAEMWSARPDRPTAVAYRGSVWQPMPALYHRQTLAAAQQALAENRRGLHALLDRINAVAIPRDDAQLPFCHANTPDELAAIERWLRSPREGRQG